MSSKTFFLQTLRQPFSLTFLALLTTLMFSSCLFFTLSRPLKTKIVACDVGQGDAIIILYGEKRILIDTGPNSDVLRCLPRVALGGQKTIDFALLTHWHKDHVGGFASVLQKYTVGKILAGTPTEETLTVTDLEEQISLQGGSEVPSIGDQIIYPGLRLRFLWNGDGLSLVGGQAPESEENASSLGTLLIGKSFGFLGMGDLECRQELAVLTLPLLSSYQILKVSHHGAKTSTCLEFLQKARPEVALISSGAGNSYGHPHPQTLEFLRKMGVFPLRTDLYGDLILTKAKSGWMLKKGPKGG